MNYISTRNVRAIVNSPEAIIKGISEDGGLFVPSDFPILYEADFAKMADMEYYERSAFVLGKFLDEFTSDELLQMTKAAYSRFDSEETAPVVKLDDNLFVLELFHGPTYAFKDIALTLLPHLMTKSKEKLGDKSKTLILVATSGDTGKAALEGFKDVDGTAIIVFYPSEGVSDMQKLQMMTQEGKNVKVVGIKGNFDDAQTAVKKVFTDSEIAKSLLAEGIKLSSANSINWGRLAPQIAYYVSTYVDLLYSDEIKAGDKINFVVPTGNFGNILAGYYAYKMGVPVGRLILASNQNKILTDFFHEGKYDANREFFKSVSPSMDILISSNLERLIFEATGRNDEAVKKLYQELSNGKKFEFDVSKIDEIFGAGWATEEETKEAISDTLEEYDYPVDTHTAVAMSVYYDYKEETEDKTATVVVSTASPYKFPLDVYNAIHHSNKKMDAFKAAQLLEEEISMDEPDGLKSLQTKKVLHDTVIEKDKIAEEVLNFAKTQRI
ncbi:MAG: threonine synthase [Christensenellales bacterium]